MTINQLLQKLDTSSPILKATFGLERENLRVTTDGHLAQTAHPSQLGSRNFHPTIQTDFSEQQLELITPIAHSTKEARRLLGAISDVAGRSIDQSECLWPLSMPPQLTEEDIIIARLENEYERHYREGLAKKYGKKLQAISGIHYNMELGKDLVAALFQVSSYHLLKDFKNDLYLKLARNFLRFRWLLTYLYGAAPLAEAGFYSQEYPQPIRSFRNSDYGYVSQTDKTLITPMVGLAPEHRGVLMGRQDLKFEGVEKFTNVSLPKPKYKHLFSKLSNEEQQQRATRGELAAALYLQAGAPKVNLPAVSPWPDVKTDDPNYAAYIWVREKGISYGWSDGKFHADAGISNATVAAFTYRAAGSPAVKGDSPYVDVKPGAPFYREILWASQNLPTVYGGQYFIPKQLLTRGHLETVLTAFQSR